MRKLTANLRLTMLRLSALLAAAVFTALALAHSVGQVQTTKFFAPETVKMLKARIDNKEPGGFRVGDTISYIIQFTPVANDATVGVAGYVTDYLPPGVEVIGAEFVTRIGEEYFPVPPQLPGGIDSGWGNQNEKTFTAPFATGYNPMGLCASRPDGQCNGRLHELHADTGIFFSTDPRTAVFPALPTRIQQGVAGNGYTISPTAVGQLNPIIGQSVATTHNLWDADQTNAFGTGAQNTIDNLATPKSAALYLGNGGRGTTPFFAGSPVAGPQTGYQFDNTANVGPWQRIAYPGSRIGDPTTGPATLPELSETAVGGMPTSLGRPLSSASPLPSNTNAVRWAVGKLVVGTTNYVRISMRITQPVPPEGIVNSSEVFGGDAGDSGGLQPGGGGANGGQDNPWRYHVPSVADNNSNLFVEKTVCVYSPGANSCTPLSGAYVPANSTITYRITYLNTGNSEQKTVTLRDILPCQTTSAATTVVVGTVTGPLALLAPLTSLPYSTTTTANGNCGSAPEVRQTVIFPTISTLASGDGGQMIVNVRHTAGAVSNDPIINTARLSSNAIPNGVSSNAVTFVGDATRPSLSIEKSALVGTTTAGGTAQYTIVVRNMGTGPATPLVIADVLPTMGGSSANASTRFNFISPTVSITSLGLSTGTALVTSTNTSANFTPALAPYDTGTFAINSEQIRWNFGAASSLAVGGVITITVNVSVGANVAATQTPYTNNAIAISGSLTDFTDPTSRADALNVAPILVQNALSVSKTMECYFHAGSCVTVQPGNTVPPDSVVRYRIAYRNTGNSTLTNVVLSDSLPCQISATTAPEVTVSAVLSGPIAPTGTATPFAIHTSSGICPNTRPGISFPAATLSVGQIGTLLVDVKLTTPATATNVIVNDVTLSNGANTSTAQVQGLVLAEPRLLITKTVNKSTVLPGGTVGYTLTITNVGTTVAQTITVYDWLPTGTSTTADITRRFSYNTPTSVVSGSLTNVAVATPSMPPSTTPYSIGTYANNQEELKWSFGSQTLAVGASASINFAATVGSNLPKLAAPNFYYNNARVDYSSKQQASAVAGVSISDQEANLRITKTNGTATTTLISGSNTRYTVTVNNFGPYAADGALLKDVPSSGLSCTTVTCSASTGGAVCPVSTPLGTPVAVGSTTLLGAGVAIPSFPANSSLIWVIDCGVTATGL